MEKHLLQVEKLKKTFPKKKKKLGVFGYNKNLVAVNNLSFYINEGETYGLVGESGCGKSTTGRMIVGLEKPDSGSILYEGKDIGKLKDKQFFPFRKEIQMVFQNSLSAQNPRKRIGNILDDILKIHGTTDANMRQEQTVSMLKKVGLSEYHYLRFPHELSGGQVQRLGIACALVIKPRLIICDEPVSALDVSVQAQILNILNELKHDLHLSLLFISHDIGVIRYIADRIGVMFLGSFVEEADTQELFKNPLHPYTRELFASIPEQYKEEDECSFLSEEMSLGAKESSGCLFYNRCPFAKRKCADEKPEFLEKITGHKVACHLY